MYLAVKDRKSANLFVAHVLSDEWNTYHYIMESGFANEPKEKNKQKVGTVAKKVSVIKSTVDKASEIISGIDSKKCPWAKWVERWCLQGWNWY